MVSCRFVHRQPPWPDATVPTDAPRVTLGCCTEGRSSSCNWAGVLSGRLGQAVAAIRFRRGTGRAFFVVEGSKAVGLCAAVESLSTTPWCAGGHMDVVLA